MRSTWTDERLDDGFRRVDQRFDEVDQRFDEFDRRFNEVDRRFDEVDRRLGRFEAGVDRRLDSNEKRLDLLTAESIELRREMGAGFEKLYKLLARLGFGLGFSMFFVLVTAFLAAR